MRYGCNSRPAGLRRLPSGVQGTPGSRNIVSGGIAGFIGYGRRPFLINGPHTKTGRGFKSEWWGPCCRRTQLSIIAFQRTCTGERRSSTSAIFLECAGYTMRWARPMDSAAHSQMEKNADRRRLHTSQRALAESWGSPQTESRIARSSAEAN